MGQAIAAAGDNQAHVAPWTDDPWLGGRLILRQSRQGVRAGDDAIFLAAGITAAPGERVIDLGTGNGAILCALGLRVPELALCGVEIDPTLAELARWNLARVPSALSVELVTGDIDAEGASVAPADHVAFNPPYFEPGRHDRSPNETRARARREATDRPLGAWVNRALALTKAGGTITLIHRAERTNDLIRLLAPHGVLLIRPLVPRAGRPAKRIVARLQLGSASSVTTLPGLVLHDSPAGYSQAADLILRDNHSLDWASS